MISSGLSCLAEVVDYLHDQHDIPSYLLYDSPPICSMILPLSNNWQLRCACGDGCESTAAILSLVTCFDVHQQL